MNAVAETRSILIAALGGEGGGVLADWLVQCARAAGLAVQATSVPGVAQRTGATSYYVEYRSASDGASQPVFALHPTVGTVDVVIASELIEAARMIERGYVSPSRTLLIASTHRILTTAEKLSPSDARYSDEAVRRAADAMSRRCVAFDMDSIARDSGTVISAVLFGALAGAGTLPWSREICEQVVRRSGRGVEASLAGFAAAFEMAVGEPTDVISTVAPQPTQEVDAQTTGWPAALQAVAKHGAARCHDFQDAAYEKRYLERVARLFDAAPRTEEATQALIEAARCLALWMSYEDVIRVADLKTRRARFTQLHVEVESKPDEIVQVYEYFKPQVDEIAAVLPLGMGLWLERFAKRHAKVARFGPALKVRSNSVSGYLLLRMLARMQPWRRRSLRFVREQQAVDEWLDALAGWLPRSVPHARVLAELPSVLKGYGDTWRRGRAHYDRLWDAFVQPAADQQDEPAAATPAAFRQALSDALSRVPAASVPTTRKGATSAQSIRFVPRPKAPPGA